MTRYRIETNDKREHLHCLHGVDYLLVLWDFDQWLRSEIKYNYDKWTGAQTDALQAAREQLHEIIDEHGVSLDDLE